MPSTTLERDGHPARDRWVWALLPILAIAQIAALWMLCLNQVRNAESRHSNQVAEQRAVEECVRQNSKGSLILCADRASGTPVSVMPADRGQAILAAQR